MQSIAVQKINVAEFGESLARRFRLFKDLFSEAERDRCLRAPRAVKSLASAVAAKKALLQAVPALHDAVRWQDLEVMPDNEGRFKFRLGDTHWDIAKRSGAKALHLSLAENDDVAVACVIVEHRPC